MVNKTWKDVRIQVADLINNYDGDGVATLTNAGTSKGYASTLSRAIVAHEKSALYSKTLNQLRSAFGISYTYHDGIPTIVTPEAEPTPQVDEPLAQKFFDHLVGVKVSAGDQSSDVLLDAIRGYNQNDYRMTMGVIRDISASLAQIATA